MSCFPIADMARRVSAVLRQSFVLGIAAILLGSCNFMNQTVVVTGPGGSSEKTKEMLRKIPTVQGNRGAEYNLQEGLKALAAGKTNPAFTFINQGLKFDPQHPHLHFLNALIYHLRANTGDSSQFELAEVGYKLALKFDPGHSLAAYQLGKLYAGQHLFGRARDAFTQALLIEPDNGSAAFGLAATSYAAGDPATARMALDRIPAGQKNNPAVLRAHALIDAALGETVSARNYLERYRTGGAEEWRIRLLTRRLMAWESFHQSEPGPVPTRKIAFRDKTIAQSSPAGIERDATMPPDTTSEPPVEPDPASSPANMVILDAVIINQESSISSSTGVNLLSGLSLMFSGNILDYARNRTQDHRTPSSSTSTTQIDRSLTIALPAVTYSLNIANAQDSQNKLLARPSVLAYDGSESEIFIGTEITYTTVGENSNSFTKEVGLTLKATPEFIDGNLTKMTIHTEFDAVAPTAAPGTFSQALATVKSRSDVVAEVRFGQTLVIGAGSSKRSSKTDNGVPVLRDIPLVKNLFNVESTSDQETSLLILITPRKPTTLDSQSGEIRNLFGNRNRSAAMSPQLDALRKRYKDWWRPTSNVLKAAHNLRHADVLKEFRRGDIRFQDLDRNLSMERGKYSAALGGIVQTLVEQIYF